MPKKTTFKVSLWREFHYSMKVEASSQIEAENKAKAEVESGSATYDHTDTFVSDVECEDPYWDEGEDGECQEDCRGDG